MSDEIVVRNLNFFAGEYFPDVGEQKFMVNCVRMVKIDLLDFLVR
jgi:hypothetical protein